MIDPDDELTDFSDQPPRPGLARRLLLLPLGVLDRVVGWWFTRRWGRILAGLPAILVSGLILLPAALSGFVNPANLPDRYKAEVNRAIAMNDPAAADVYLRKLLRLDAMDPEMRYAMAFVAQQQGDHEQAKSILTELASGDNGHPQASLWMAKQMSAGKSEWTAEERETLIRHLQAALRMEPPPNEANVMLGQLYLQNKNNSQAIKYFEAALPQRPELHLSLGQIYLQLGDAPRAKRELQQAAEYFQSRVAATPKDVNGRVAWALAYRLQNDFPRAKEILLAGLAAEAENPTLRNFLASFCIDEFDALAKPDDRNLDTRLQLLETAMLCSPDNPAALNRLATFGSMAGEVGDRAREKLQEVLAAGKATATIHLILAIQAITKGDSELAALHFEQGHQLNPNQPVLLNNFAWLLANQDPPQLDRALTLVNRALESLPNEPSIRETRGQIYVKLNRWREALADLEFALPQMSGNRELHAALARVYHELGDDEVAGKHKQLAEAK